MIRTRLSRFAALVLCGGLAAYSATASAADRKPEEILKEIDAVQMPTPPKERTQEAFNAYRTKAIETLGKKAELIGELHKVDPDNAKLSTLLPQRWSALALKPETADKASEEIAAYLPKVKDEKQKESLLFLKATIPLRQEEVNVAKAKAAIEEFIAAKPKDERGAQLLSNLAMQIDDEKEAIALYKRIAKDFAGSRSAKSVEGKLRQAESVGKPFELEFKEAITGSQISMKGLKGKVVVVDFWATWCGPCIAEMPKMKKLYAEMKDKGVEFIGVSLDQPKEKGGYDKLKAYVEENKIEWPQYYQGNYWQSEFSTSWGINSIPAVFVVDQEGKLYSVNARGKLDKMIPELLAKAKK